MSKGDKRRPTQVQEDTFASNWARVFGERILSEKYTQALPPEPDMRPDGLSTTTERIVSA